MTSGFFVTGTDTEIGKTTAACALLHWLAHKHDKVVGMKPVAAGADRTEQGWLNEDVARLRAASTLAVPPELDNPYVFPLPISPHLAAAEAGQTIELARIVRAYRQLAQQANAVVVEGAGGFCVPLTAQHTGADLAQALQLPVLLVVGIRLGCLNHALLTQEAIQARGLTLAGWIANAIDPQAQAAQRNIETLQKRLNAPLWANIPWMPEPRRDVRTIPFLVPPP